MGGWFTSLDVEYLDKNGNWKKASQVKIDPPLPEDKETFIRPNFVEYILTFEPVNTKAIKIVGNAGGIKHWHEDTIYHFSSISELSVYSSIPGL